MGIYRSRRVLPFLGGMLLGAVGVLLGLLVFLAGAPDLVVRDMVAEGLRLPEGAYRPEPVEVGAPLRVAASDFVIDDPRGGEVLHAPEATFTFATDGLGSGEPVRLYDMVVRDPRFRIVENPDGTINLLEALAGPEPPQPREQPGLILADLRITGGRGTVAVGSGFPLPDGPGTFPLREIRNLQTRVTQVAVGGPGGFAIDIADLRMDVPDPGYRVLALSGAFRGVEPEGIRFDLRRFETDASRMAGEGLLVLGDAGPVIDGQLRVERLAFADVRHFWAGVPDEGWARFVLDAEPRPGGRMALAVRDALVQAEGSTISGRLAAVVGGDLPPVFHDTRLELDPLDLATIARLGLVDELPYTGLIRGTVASVEAMEGLREGVLWLAVTGEIRAAGRTVGPPTIVSATGPFAFDLGATPGLRLDGLRLEVEPLLLADLDPLVDLDPRFLRGTLLGGARLTGTLADLAVADGAFTLNLPDAPASTLTAVSGRLQMEPVFTYALDARLEPLALGTLTALFPALPFRVSTLEGPISLRGTAERLTFEADLVGEAGELDVGGVIAFNDPVTFDVSGRVGAFRAALLLEPDVPVRGPLTGTFAVRGSTEDVRFDVDLMQAGGTLALGGRVRLLPDGPWVDVAGTLNEFPLGSVIGRPGLFPSPLTGTLAVEGAADRYDYEVDLTGDEGRVDLAGFFEPGPIPRYRAVGQVVGLDLSRLPLDMDLPRSRVTATVEIDAEGLTPETFAGRVRLASDGSMVGGYEVDRARIDLLAQGGILDIDAFDILYRRTRLTASGMLGLARPAPEPLQYTFDSPDISVLRPFLPDPGNGFLQLAGQLRAEGWMTGTVAQPTIGASLAGRQLRYGDWRAADLRTTLTLAREAAGWRGGGTLLARDAIIPTGERFETVRIEGVADPAAVSFAAFAARPGDAGDLAVTATLDMVDGTPVALVLQSLEANIADARWQLVAPSRIAWAGIDGVRIENLQLLRVGHGDGFIRIDGHLPDEGDLALDLRIDQLNLAELRALVPGLPPIQGILSLAVDVRGPLADPVMDLRGEIEGAQVEGMGLDRIAIIGRYDDQRLDLDLDFWMGPMQVANAEAAIPLSVSFAGLAPTFELREDAPLTAAFAADSLPIGFVAASTPGLRDGEGAIAAQVEIGGTLSAPTAEGWLDVNEGAVTVDELGARYHGINGRLVLLGDELRIDTLVVRGGDGVARFGGFVRFDDREQPLLSLTAGLRDFRAVDREDARRVAVSGDLTLTGRIPEPVLRGRAVIEEGSITAPAIGRQPPIDLADLEVGEIGDDVIPEGVADRSLPLLGNLVVDNLEVELGDRVWIISDELRVQMGGAVTVFHAGNTTRLAGELRVERGTFLLSIGPIVREFDILQGSVRFFGTPDLDPAIELTAANEVRTMGTGGPTGSILTILVNVEGTLQRPTLELTSDTRPPLPEAELLSFLIFGRPSFQLGEGTGQLAQQILLQEAIGGFFATQIEQILLRDIGLPLDYLRVRARPTEFTNPLGLTAIEAGVDLGRNIFWSVETGVPAVFGGVEGPTWGTHLEWQIDREWSWRLSYEPIRRDPILQRFTLGDLTHQFSTDLRRRWEYGHPAEEVPLPDLRDPMLPADPAVERIDPEAVPLDVPEEEPEQTPEPEPEPTPVPPDGREQG
jgi:hypothetical protein